MEWGGGCGFDGKQAVGVMNTSAACIGGEGDGTWSCRGWVSEPKGGYEWVKNLSIGDWGFCLVFHYYSYYIIRAQENK